MKQFLSKLLSLIIIILFPVFLSSCGEDEPELPDDNTENNQENNNNNNTLTYKQIEQLAKANISIEASYADYITTFTITSTLSDKLPSSYTIEYAIGHTSRYPAETIYASVGKQAYYYEESREGDKLIITIKNPFWYYYVIVEEDDDIWAKSVMYYSSYIALKEKGLGNLTEDEQSLYNSLVKILNEYEKEAAKYYIQDVEVCVNNRFYSIGKYPLP